MFCLLLAVVKAVLEAPVKVFDKLAAAEAGRSNSCWRDWSDS